MAINQTCLESEIQTAVDNLTTSCSAEVFLETAIAADNANTNRKFSVALGCQLPDLQTANIPPGTMVYVEEFRVPLVATQKEWKGLDGRLYRKDIPDTPIFSWGYNTSGWAAANTSYTNHSSPVQEITSSDWCVATVGGSTSKAIKIDGTLWAAGYGNCGNLGNGSTTSYCSYVQEFFSSTNWCHTHARSYTTTGAKSDGTLWGWGFNDCYLVGVGIRSNMVTPVQEVYSATDWCCALVIGTRTGFALKKDGSLWHAGSNYQGAFGSPSVGVNCNCYSYVQEDSSSTWEYLGTSDYSFFGVKIDGTLWSSGGGFAGMRGDNSTAYVCSLVQEASLSTDWSQVTGSGHALGLKTNGTLWVWGCGSNGRLGLNSTVAYSSPVQEITSSTNWCNISASDAASHGIKTDGTLWSWGASFSGVLATNSTIDFSSPVQEFTSATNWSILMNESSDINGVIAIKNII